MGVTQQILAGFLASGDTDAEAFITAAAITDATQKSAIRQLVTDLKAASLWTKMVAIYPYVGAAATPHSFNLKNTATFQISWSGTITHNSNGVTGNGTTGLGITGLIPSSSLSLNDVSLGAYSRTNSTENAAAMGCNQTTSNEFEIWPKFTDNKAYGEIWKAGAATDEIAVTVTTSQGLFTMTRRSTTDAEMYQNATSLGNTTGTSAGGRPGNSVYVLALNTSGSPGSFSTRNYAFHYIGLGLTDGDVSNLYTAVQAFQTTLGRQV